MYLKEYVMYFILPFKMNLSDLRHLLSREEVALLACSTWINGTGLYEKWMFE